MSMRRTADREARRDRADGEVRATRRPSRGRARACGTSAAIVPTLPDQPVACARPLTATSPAMTGHVGAIAHRERDAAPTAAMPISTFLRGPSFGPSATRGTDRSRTRSGTPPRCCRACSPCPSAFCADRVLRDRERLAAEVEADVREPRRDEHAPRHDRCARGQRGAIGLRARARRSRRAARASVVSASIASSASRPGPRSDRRPRSPRPASPRTSTGGDRGAASGRRARERARACAGPLAVSLTVRRVSSAACTVDGLSSSIATISGSSHR